MKVLLRSNIASQGVIINWIVKKRSPSSQEKRSPWTVWIRVMEKLPILVAPWLDLTTPRSIFCQQLLF